MPSSPQIGIYTPQVNPTEAMPRRITPSRDTSPVGGAISQLGGVIQQLDEQNAAVQASKLMATTRLKWTQTFLEGQEKYQPGDDFTGTMVQGFKDYHKEALKSIKSPLAKQFVDKQLTSFGTELGTRAMEFQASAQVTGRIQTYKDGMNTAANVVAADPTQFEKSRDEQLMALSQLQINPQQKAQLAEETTKTMAFFAAKTMGERDPYNTMVALTKADAGSPILNRLTPEQRAQVQDHILTVQRMVQSQEDHQIALQDRQQKKASDDLLKQGILMGRNGQLSPQWIEQHHATWEPSAYEYMYKLASGASTVTNTQVYAPLLDRALRGEDVSEEAQKALFGGQLHLDDYNRLAEKSASPRQNWVKRGAEYISTSAGVSQLNPDPAGAQRKAKMLDEWDDWVSKNPSATDQAARSKYQGIVHDYALVDANKTTLLTPLPHFAVGDRRNLDVDATEKATVKAYKDKTLSDSDFAEQAAIIAQWRRAMAAKNVKPQESK